MFFDLGRVENNSNAGHLRCISGLVRTGKSDDDKDLDWILLIAARATSAELELSVHLLCLAQETSEKNTPNVLLRRLLRKPQQIHGRERGFFMVFGVSSGTRLGPKGDDAVSTGHGELPDLVEKLVTKRAKRRARKIEQKKKKTPEDGFQPRRELEG